MAGSSDSVLSHWHTLFEDFSTSTQDFYTSVEAAIARRTLPDIEVSRVLWSEGGIGSAKREYLRVRRERIAFDICSAPYGNGHFFSWWLARIPPRFGILFVFAILIGALAVTGLLQLILTPMLPRGLFRAFAQVGLPFLLYPVVLLVLGFMVREGDLGDEEWVMSLPVLGWLYIRLFNPLTYYRLDTAMMFRDSIRAAVSEVINDVRQEKGLRLLEESAFLPQSPEGRSAG